VIGQGGEATFIRDKDNLIFLAHSAKLGDFFRLELLAVDDVKVRIGNGADGHVVVMGGPGDQIFFR
jgi:hypothetical protein